MEKNTRWVLFGTSQIINDSETISMCLQIPVGSSSTFLSSVWTHYRRQMGKNFKERKTNATVYILEEDQHYWKRWNRTSSIQENFRTGFSVHFCSNKLKKSGELIPLMKSHVFSSLRVVGLMASCVEQIPYARLCLRPIKLHLFWKPSSRDVDFESPLHYTF